MASYELSRCACGAEVYQTPDGTFEALPKKQLVPAGRSGLGGPYADFDIRTPEGWRSVGVVPVFEQHLCSKVLGL